MTDTLRVAFSVRKMRADLRERLRVLATLEARPIEALFNDVVEAGLTAREDMLPPALKRATRGGP